MPNGNWIDRNGLFLDVTRNYIIICWLQKYGLLWIWRPLLLLVVVAIASLALLVPQYAIGIIITSGLLSLPLLIPNKSRTIIGTRKRKRRKKPKPKGLGAVVDKICKEAGSEFVEDREMFGGIRIPDIDNTTNPPAEFRHAESESQHSIFITRWDIMHPDYLMNETDEEWDPDLYDLKPADLYFVLAEKYMDVGDIDYSIAICKVAIEKFPDSDSHDDLSKLLKNLEEKSRKNPPPIPDPEDNMETKLIFEPAPPQKIWYYAQGKHMYGPISFPELRSLTNDGNIVRDDYVWRAGFEEWVLADTIPNLFQKSSYVGIN